MEHPHFLIEENNPTFGYTVVVGKTKERNFRATEPHDALDYFYKFSPEQPATFYKTISVIINGKLYEARVEMFESALVGNLSKFAKFFDEDLKEQICRMLQDEE